MTEKGIEQPSHNFISLDSNFDWSNVVVAEPKKNSFTKGKSTIEWTTSEVYVEGPKGEKLPIFIELAEQNVWGIYGMWPIGTTKEERSLETLEGFQIYYPITSFSTMENPTAEERATRYAFDMMWNITVHALKRFCNKKDKSKRKVPAPTYSAYRTAKYDEDWTYPVKPIYDWTLSKDPTSGKKSIDKSKPQRAYLRFVTKGKGARISCQTKIYGPGDRQVSPSSIWGSLIILSAVMVTLLFIGMVSSGVLMDKKLMEPLCVFVFQR